MLALIWFFLLINGNQGAAGAELGGAEASCDVIAAPTSKAVARWRRGKKLTGADVEKIRVDISAGRPRSEIAAEYGIHEGYIFAIRAGRCWKNTTGRQQSPQKERIASEPSPVAGAKWIPLTCGKFALIDEQFFDAVSLCSWQYVKCGRSYTGYAEGGRVLTNGRYHKAKLHRVVWELSGRTLPPAIDHENRDGLDCRIANLRPATAIQNLGNRTRNKNGSSGFKGVSWSLVSGRWRAQIGVNWKQKYLGLFHSAEDAARAYDRAAIEYFGEFARLNFPTETHPLSCRSDETSSVPFAPVAASPVGHGATP